MHKFSVLVLATITVWWGTFSKAESNVPLPEIYKWLLAADVGLEYAGLVLQAWGTQCDQLDEGMRREVSAAEQRIASLRGRMATQAARYHDQLLAQHGRETASAFVERTLQQRANAREQMLESIKKDSLRPDRCSVDIDVIRGMPPKEVEEAVNRYAQRTFESG